MHARMIQIGDWNLVDRGKRVPFKEIPKEYCPNGELSCRWCYDHDFFYYFDCAKRYIFTEMT